MASKKKQHQRGGEDLKREDVLQAVVIADSFNVRFAPITRRRPRCLLPLVNVALLDYTLEFLCSSGVQEVFVFCCAHADQVREHISKSKWSRSTSQCVVTPISSEDCLSVGDALRDIDNKELIQSDFILVNGDMVSNLRLKPILEEHKQRREKLKSPVMTMVFKQAAPRHRTRCREEEVLLATDSANQRILHYQKIGTQKKFDFPVEMFQEHSDFQLRFDLLDTHICICSPQVPQLFTDNFDYLTRDDFVRGILVNEEILGNTIHTHIIEDEYAARVSNLQMYDAISKDVISRWVYPLVPDNEIENNHKDKYSHGKHNVYLNKDVTLARGCVLREDVVIGQGTCIGCNTVISHSVVGRNCKIGENVSLQGAYVWDGVTIDNNTKVSTSILCDNVHVKQNVTIEPGCVLSYDVVVGPDVTLPPNTYLNSEPVEDEDGFSDDEDAGKGTVIDQALVGSEGKAYQYQPTDSDSETEDLVQDVWGLNIQSDEDEVSLPDMSPEPSPPSSPPPDDSKLFYNEVLDTLERAVTENIGPENVVLEINSMKHAYNIAIKEVNLLVVKAMVEYPQRNVHEMEPTKLITGIKKLLSKMMPVLKNYIKSDESQMDCLLALEDFSLHHPTTAKILIKLLQMLYNSDILSEEVIVEWYEDHPMGEEQQQKMALRKQVAPFIQWLQEAEEESESD